MILLDDECHLSFLLGLVVPSSLTGSHWEPYNTCLDRLLILKCRLYLLVFITSKENRIKVNTRYRWFVLLSFLFHVTHQADKLLISPLTTPIMEYFDINEAQMGLVTSALADWRHIHPLGVIYMIVSHGNYWPMSFLWGATTWLSALAKTFGVFITCASTGIDDASYPGLYSLISDYFPPKFRKVYGICK